jgi:hypothetical protein
MHNTITITCIVHLASEVHVEPVECRVLARTSGSMCFSTSPQRVLDARGEKPRDIVCKAGGILTNFNLLFLVKSDYIEMLSHVVPEKGSSCTRQHVK